jgi:non-canonical purine NTP pyrophosphatase (RdgB/HAM1 family)
MKRKPIVFITGNDKKVEQVRRYLTYPLEHRKIDLPEIQSLDSEEIIFHKTLEAYRLIKSPVLVEDTSLVFEALGKLPGPFIKWYEREIGYEEICRSLDMYKSRKATAMVTLGYFDGKKFSFFKGTTKGSIAKQPKGEASFGWDCIFIPEGKKKTRGEMTQIEKDRNSMRKKAVMKLNRFLKK